MKITTLYVISYLPDDAKLRAKRKDLRDKALDYWMSKDIDIVVLAQNYTSEDYRSNVEYITRPGPVMRPGPARNELLKLFYERDADFGLFLDDDISLYEGSKYMLNDTFLESFRETGFDQYNGVGVIRPIYPSQQPFTKYFEDNNDLLRNNIELVRNSTLFGGFMMIRNFKKHHGFELYFRDRHTEDGSVDIGEDVMFAMDSAAHGFGMFVCSNIVCKDMGYEHSTWSASGGDRKESKEGLRAALVDAGMTEKNGKIQWSAYLDKHQIRKKVIVPLKADYPSYFR